MVQPAEGFQTVHRIDGLSGGFSLRRGKIEARQEFQTGLLKGTVFQQRLAHLSGAHHHDAHTAVDLQNGFDVLDQGAARIAQLPSAAVGDLGQVLAHHYIAQPQSPGDAGGGDVYHALRQRFQVFQIDGKPHQQLP